MAGKPIEIQLDAETQGAEAGIERVADSLDDATKAADKLGDEGAKSGEKVEDSAKDAARVIDRDLTKALEDASKASKKTGDDIGDDIKRGTDQAGEGLDDFKSEAASTARETAASFDGSADSIAGGFQEVAANALAGFGPLGAGAGLALAAGFGILTSRIQGDAELNKQVISDMYDDFLESGSDFLSKEYVAEQLGKIYKGADDAAIKVKELRDLATAADIPEPLLARALVGDEQSRKEVVSAIAEQRLAIAAAIDEATAKGGNIAPTLDPAMQALREIEDLVSGTAETFTTTQQNAAAARDAIAGITAPTQGAAASAEDARSKFNGLGEEISKLPPVKLVVDVDTRQADTALDLWRRRQSAAGIAVGVRAYVQQPV